LRVHRRGIFQAARNPVKRLSGVLAHLGARSGEQSRYAMQANIRPSRNVDRTFQMPKAL